ncbi:MAG TPA: metallophosphoesterase [Planctomycetota bacterium]|nr:metallophosphoesterase [Planctomycetota bacterium]HRR81837.1 metallophosphoesterase [Planctomycetota bacterium]HRT96672.1 metallophosphoesterase [Planctomycetota bacterium]
MARLSQRRRVLRSVAGALLGLLGAFGAYGYWEAGQLELVPRTLVFDDLPPAFDGFRVLHLSDLHTAGFGRVERRLRRLLEATPADLLVFTGDFKAHANTRDARVFDSLGRLFAGLEYPYGLIAVAGNHDSPGFLMALPDRTPFYCLVRSGLLLERRGQRLALLGVATVRPNDGIRGEHEMDEASWVGNLARRTAPFALLPDDRPGPFVCDAVNRGDVFRILLAHVPDFLRKASAEGIDLVLAGDTHGAQVRLPFDVSLLVKPPEERRYVAGHFTEGRTQMIVSRGIGTLYVPIRFLARPEVTLLTLRRRQDR